MNFHDKLAKATIVSSYLVGTAYPLEDELEDRGWGELIGDADFKRLVMGRCYPCADCGFWMPVRHATVLYPMANNPKYCDECNPSHGRRRNTQTELLT